MHDDVTNMANVLFFFFQGRGLVSNFMQDLCDQ